MLPPPADPCDPALQTTAASVRCVGLTCAGLPTLQVKFRDSGTKGRTDVDTTPLLQLPLEKKIPDHLTWLPIRSNLMVRSSRPAMPAHAFANAMPCAQPVGISTKPLSAIAKAHPRGNIWCLRSRLLLRCRLKMRRCSGTSHTSTMMSVTPAYCQALSLPTYPPALTFDPDRRLSC